METAQKEVRVSLTHLPAVVWNVFSKKWGWGSGAVAYSVDSYQTPQNAASDKDLHCLHLVQEFHGNNTIKLPDIPYVGNGLDQRIEVEESTRHKWVNSP